MIIARYLRTFPSADPAWFYLHVSCQVSAYYNNNFIYFELTVEEYYDRQSRHILDTIVDTLGKDKRHKFIWEEMSYLER